MREREREGEGEREKREREMFVDLFSVLLVSFATAAVTVDEGKEILLSIFLNFAADKNVAVNITTLDGTAEGDQAALISLYTITLFLYYYYVHTGGVDYSTLSLVITFLAGETNSTIIVHTLDDSISELKETFAVVLSHSSEGLAIAEKNTTVVSVVDTKGVYVCLYVYKHMSNV